MNLLCVALWQLSVAALPRTELVPMPTDVSGLAQGINAASFDPAAAGRLDGAELQLRQLGVAGAAGHGAWSGYGAVPVGPLSLYAGYEWRSLPNPTSERGSFGASLALLPNLRLGASLRRLQLPGSDVTHSVWDAGLAGQPSRYISWSLGGDALNAPAYRGLVHVNRTLRLGFAVRPWRGDARFVVAADTRIQQLAGGWALPNTRVLLEAGLVDGVHVMGGYARRDGAHEAFAGLRVDVWHAAVQSSAQVDNRGTPQGIDRFGFVLSLRSHPQEDVARPMHRRIEIPLEGQLNAPPQGLFHPGKAISTVNLQLDALAQDPTVDTVVLPIDHLQVGLGQIAELRQSILAVVKAGKRVIAKLHDADNKSMMVASAASEIEMDPLGFISLKGFSVASHFFAESLQKIGVRFEAVGIGQYKSAPDALTESAPRPQDQEIYDELLTGAYARLVDSLVVDRHLSLADCNTVLSQGLWGAEAAKRLGLIDTIAPRPDAAWRDNETPPARSFAQSRTPTPMWGRPNVIAIVPVLGTIVAHAADNPMPSTSAEAGRITDLLDAALQDPSVAGIVVRIDSPGGDVFASETIWRAVRRATEHKPVAVSMGDVAASGGYYLAAPVGRIFAEPTSITGSIGIFLVKPDVSGLLAWAGVHRHVYSQGPHADWDSVAHAFAQGDRARLHSRLQSLYEVFVDRIAEGRHLPHGTVRDLAQGRVYSGARAQALGLVDELGGLNEAVAWVKQQARLQDDAHTEVHLPDRTVSLPQLVSGMSRLAHQAIRGPDEVTNFVDTWTQSYARRLQSVETQAWALLPYELELTQR